MVCTGLIEGAELAVPASDSIVVRRATLEGEAERAVVTKQPDPESGIPATAVEPEISEIWIPTWNLGERIPIAPQVWDADTPQVGEGVAGSRLGGQHYDLGGRIGDSARSCHSRPRGNRRRRNGKRRRRNQRHGNPKASSSYS
jgi:hypothetical protein